MDHPRMMYRPGTSLEWHGLNLDTRIVADEREEQAAIKEGWSVSPFDLAEKPKKRRPKKG